MLWNAGNITLTVEGGQMHGIRFGSGPRSLIMLPGLGDGVTTVRGKALPMALMYRMFARDFTVFMLSRRENLPQGATTRDMARDVCLAMDALGIERADVLGVSMGGMIAQHLAAEAPQRVNRLVLAVTCSESGVNIRQAVEEWNAMAEAGDHTAFMDSNVRLIYSDDYYRKSRWLIPVMGKLTRPASYSRYFVQAAACLGHNATDVLGAIAAPTLVIGGGQDRVVNPDASRQLAAGIPGAALKLYPQWGHGLYEEAKDFNEVVLRFLRDGVVI